MEELSHKVYSGFSLSHVLIPLGGIFCLFPIISSASALALGLAIALFVGNPYQKRTKRMSPLFLSLAVMGLGAGMNLGVIGRVGLQGIGYTIIGIGLTFLLGTLLGRLFNTPKNTSLLLSVGTAICGGSAIAALAPVIKAKDHEVSIALATVFLLNAVALVLFVPLGHFFNLSQTQFGLWSALAIHDTSSVVGSCINYGKEALEVGTTIKLARALWIMPIAFLVGYFRSKNEHDGGLPKKRPWFIVGFLVAAAIVTFFPSLAPLGHSIEEAAKRLMIVTLFLIGSNLTRASLNDVGLTPFVQGLCLWLIISTFSLTAIVLQWIE